MDIIKHTIELKLPKIFGKKKVDETGAKTEVKTEINLENKEQYIIIGTSLALGLTVGYLIGHHRGINKMLNRVFVVK